METTITITTINKPVFIEDLCKNIKYNRQGDVDILITGDEKTPLLEEYCQGVQGKYDIPIVYLSVTSQLQEFPTSLLAMFDYNTPDRTILGGIMAYQRGAKRIIAVDDDNFPTSSDFVGGHKIVNRYTNDRVPEPATAPVTLISSDTGWFNVYQALTEENNVPFYPRGYPLNQRYKKTHTTQSVKQTRVMVNQGLVLGDPDIDALQRLVCPINATQSNHRYPAQFGLEKTWSPFNYQNTCIARDLIPCYFRPKSGSRNADIWTAYIFNKLVEHMGDTITFGEPHVKQIRNEHSLWDDLLLELQNNQETDYFCDLIREIELTAETYFDAIVELVDKVEVDATHPMTKSFFEEYRSWLKTITQIL